MKKRTWKDEMLDKEFCVAIFGSARIQKKDKSYKQIYELGRMLGERNIDIVTGGGPGLMEAANSGHQDGSKKTGAHSIGLNIKLPKEQKPNSHLDLLKEFSSFTKRLDEFMFLSNAIVVAPGGVGTMLEMLYAWQLVQVEHIHNIPIILLDDFWNGFSDWLKKEPLQKKYFSKEEFNMLFFAKNYSEVIKIIDSENKKFIKNRKKV